MFSRTNTALHAPSLPSMESLEDRLCFSSPSGAAITLSAHQRHVRHQHHVHVQRGHGSGIVLQVTTIGITNNANNVNSNFSSFTPLASFGGNMALISGAFGTTATGMFRI